MGRLNCSWCGSKNIVGGGFSIMGEKRNASSNRPWLDFASEEESSRMPHLAPHDNQFAMCSSCLTDSRTAGALAGNYKFELAVTTDQLKVQTQKGHTEGPGPFCREKTGLASHLFFHKQAFERGPTPVTEHLP